MITNRRIRTLSGFLLFGRTAGRKDWETTDRWRDKRAQGALRSGGCFCLAILSQTHIALLLGNVHRVLKSLILLAFPHLAGARHDR
jgi:hypothetical protein